MKIRRYRLPIWLLGIAGLTAAPTIAAEEVRLLLPEVIYAVPGVETNLYYDNLITVINSKNYSFRVRCAKGRMDEARWRFTPEAGDVGEYPLELSVSGPDGVAAEGRTRIVVSPADAGRDRAVRVLMIGASQTAASVYPRRVLELMRESGVADFRLLGTNGPGYRPDPKGEVAHEGWGGWGWGTFFTRYGREESARNDGLHPVRQREANSRFLFPGPDGKIEFDFARYCEKYADGQKPDFVTILLGINDVFFGTDETMPEIMKNKVFAYLEPMVAAIRRAAPDCVIGIALLPPPAASQDAFGANYGCQQTRYQVRKNLDCFNRAVTAKCRELRIDVIPLPPNLDTVNGFPTVSEAANANCPETVIRQSNAFHPAEPGYRQFADVFYAWLKYRLNRKP